MNIHDRIALELGRALMRAHGAEVQLSDEKAKNAALTEQLADAAPKAAPRRREK